LTINFVYSPGGVTPLNKTALFQEQANSPFAAANYVYDTLTLTEATRLPFNATWVMRLTGQLADHNLLPTEELGLGGETSVRGYHERVANGSEGAILTEELRSPPFSQLSGAGGGLRYTVSRFLSVGLDYGHELLRAPGATNLTNVLHVSVALGN
jgi:hemolysin activation/secretion protein